MMFQYVLYHGYTRRAFKRQDNPMPSIGITTKYFCPIHHRFEFFYGVDVDYHLSPSQIQSVPDNCYVVDTGNGNHVICVDHSTHYLLSILKSFIMVRRYHGDLWWLYIGVKRGYVIFRVFGKYETSPTLSIVRKARNNDPIFPRFYRLYRGQTE